MLPLDLNNYTILQEISLYRSVTPNVKDSAFRKTYQTLWIAGRIFSNTLKSIYE